jgi:pyruvate,water dikinase
LAEIAFETAGMMPEISYGSHFFQDLVESNIFYMAILPQKKTVTYQPEIFAKNENILSHLLPNQAKWESVITVIDCSTKPFMLYSDIVSQKVLMIDTDDSLTLDA